MLQLLGSVGTTVGKSPTTYCAGKGNIVINLEGTWWTVQFLKLGCALAVNTNGASKATPVTAFVKEHTLVPETDCTFNPF